MGENTEKAGAVVTGANRGIGLAIARRLAAQGHHVIGLARTSPKEDFPGEFVNLDFSDSAATREVLAGIAARHKVLRLVNNAARFFYGEVETAEFAHFENLVAVNLAANMLTMQAFVPHMRAAGFGRIVNMGSRSALGKHGRLLYGMTKAGIVGLTRNAALELAPFGITVNCISPGPIETEGFTAGNMAPGTPQREAFVNAIPVRRVGQPEEIAAACMYFMSDEAGYTTGQTLNVCGGLTIGVAAI
ncbi:SDR family NAD(P)-dependent oxidoreductase [Xanthobacter tagetidis]|uniref:SDR family oxidoreductase n=1 Tax=Xanthobacter tagetidis TaxID=60216 RepID=A0A3L7A5N0_9HYPH|nr:SDR family oxidoreductase [Xanthobacter tagetidis]MBB6309930.1 NAD(P)-dependent dehydrogenase (short-subunit alcohol dehydrogenase family) [Xanthobacter tagetidis]RLP74642.1 SDR family oxidoreductase [Xanthobacter tagetidis]